MELPSHIVSAPGRLHFGLFSVGPIESCDTHPQFGGMGMMVAWPRQVLVAEQARKLQIFGADRAEIEKAIEHWFRFYSTHRSQEQSINANHFRQLPICIRQSQALPRHVGLGSGTQLSLSVNALADRFFQLTSLGPIETAIQSGRGKRSAIGSYGFFQGGFLVDRGKYSLSDLAKLDLRTDFPSAWPILIAIPKQTHGIAGTGENEAFLQLPATAPNRRESMVELAKQIIVPALMRGDYDQFANGIYQFGRLSGRHFATVQGGVYNGVQVTKLIQQIRRYGVKAVGQSSWGPSVFAICENRTQIEWLSDRLEMNWRQHYHFLITEADNRGARIEQQDILRDNKACEKI